MGVRGRDVAAGAPAHGPFPRAEAGRSAQALLQEGNYRPIPTVGS